MATNPDGDTGAKNNTAGGGDDEEKGGQSEQQKQNQQKKKKQKKHNQEAANPLEIQAVCSTVVESRIWLAVSRENKTLSLYSIVQSEADRESVEVGEEGQTLQQKTKKIVHPTITYNIPKRARCLAFSSVASSTPDGQNCHIIMAGDLSGDAIGFPVPATSSNASVNISASVVTDPPITDAGANATTPTVRRLLLGHTASILTGLNVAPTTAAWDKQTQQKQLLILTADRDEKVRVSYFPETYTIHGYLLGHSSFISTMDAAAVAGPLSSVEDGGSQRSLCITGSGDGTVRLWDYQSCKEVGMVPVVIKKCYEDEKMSCEDISVVKEKAMEKYVEEDEEEGVEEDFNEDFVDDEQSFHSHAIAVPLSVALAPNARKLIVARDGIPSIDIHPIPKPPSKSSAHSSTSLLLSHLVSLHKKQTLGCPSQPLAVRCLSDGSVLVLARGPDYLLHFQCDEDSTEFRNMTSTSPFSVALQGAVNNEHISMPETTLERDEDGEFKLQKNKVNDSGDNAHGQGESAGDKPKKGPHWNDACRKETAKLAEQRRRKRRRNEAKEVKVGSAES